jgi:hypothetical protein
MRDLENQEYFQIQEVSELFDKLNADVDGYITF